MPGATGKQLDPESINAVKLDQGDGTTRAQGGVGAAGLVNTTGAAGPSLDRDLAVTTDFTVGTRYREDYGVDGDGNKLGPKAILITVTGGSADSKFLFDEPDTAAANAMLAAGGGGGVSVPYKQITPDDEIERRLIVFPNRIRYIDFIAGTGATRVEIEGV